MENVLILHGDIFHGNLWRNFNGIPWKFFTREALTKAVAHQHCDGVDISSTSALNLVDVKHDFDI